MFKSVLADSALTEAVFLCEGGPTIIVPASELRRILPMGPDHYDGKIWGPFNIDPENHTISGHKVLMDVKAPPPAAPLPKFTPNYYLAEADYYQLTGPGFWHKNDVPIERLKLLKQFPAEKTVAVFASGVNPMVIPAKANVSLGGIDWIRFEKNPGPDEPSINVDHYIIGPSGVNGFSVWGPFKSGGIAPHWPTGCDPFRGYFSS